MQAIFMDLFWVFFFLLFSLFCVLELCFCVCYCGSLSSNAELVFEFQVYVSHTHIFYTFFPCDQNLKGNTSASKK